jgi:mannosylfructose-phosphate synthase
MLKHICHLSTHGFFDPVPQLGKTDTGGQVVYVLELAKALARRGTKVDIYTRWFDRERKQVDPVPGCPDVRVIRIHSGPWEFIRKEDIYAVLPELSAGMADFIRKENLDYELYHGHYVDAGIVALDVAAALGKPCFFTPHSLGAWKRQQMGGDPDEMERVFNFKHRVAEEIRIFKSVVAQTMTTHLQVDKIAELYDFRADNIDVIPPGVDVERFHPAAVGEAEAELDLPENFIFCLSRIDSNKGHDFLLHAFDIVKDRIPGVQLLIGGGSPKPRQVELEVRAMMKRIIDEKKMHDRVRILGYVPDEALTTYYRKAGMFVLPSKFEPFGMTVLEAMACGTAVIASRMGGIRENITQGKNGFLVDPSDRDEFAAAMVDLLSDPAKTEAMGRAGREFVLAEFSWDAIARKFTEFYDKYLGR